MRRFPLRTLLLMILALIVFVRLYLITHQPRGSEPKNSSAPRAGMEVEVAPSTATAPAAEASPACNTLDRALDGVVRNPEDASALAEAKRQIEACPAPPVRACELGAALNARVPLATGDTPARGLLKALCQRCPAEANGCAGSVTRMLEEASMGRAQNSGEALWNLENAGPGTAAACASVVRLALVPAAMARKKLRDEVQPLLAALTPPCVKAGQVPTAVLSAAVVEQGALAGGLVGLITAQMDGGSRVAPAQITGAEAGGHAFDGNEKSGVDLGNGRTVRWEADGALRAQFEPPLKQLTSLRVRAKGEGTLRALIRLPQGLGLKDPERGTFFVNPTVCQFKGTGQWEACALKVPLLDVEALSVFPAQPKISLYEVEAKGTR